MITNLFTKRLLTFLAVIGMSAGLFECTQPSGGQEDRYVKMSDIYKSREEWPFVGVDSFKVDCIDMRAVMITSSGETYALNGFARIAAKEKGWLDEESIHIKYRDVGPILELAKKKCDTK